MISNLLREHTAQLHRRIERCVDIERRWQSLPEYRRLLAELLGLVEPLERMLASIDWGPAGIDFEAHRRTDWLIADLGALQLDRATIAELPRCRSLPRVGSLAAGLGCLYVLEGAGLGGQIIAREVRSRLGVGPSSGGSFHAGHGQRTGAMWRRFRAAADAYVGEDPRKIADALAAADAALHEFVDWMDRKPNPVRVP